MKNVFREFWVGVGAMAPLANEMSLMGRVLNRVRLFGSGRVDINRDGFSIYIDNQLSTGSFYISGIDGNQATITAGHLSIVGIGAWEAAEATVTLTGATCWAYLRKVKSASAVTINGNSVTSYPTSNASEVRVALHKFTSSDGGTTYIHARDCRFDVNLGTPL